jgi:hypothetical protein
MDEHRAPSSSPTQTESERRLRLRRRAKRGLVASYIHGLSARQNGVPSHAPERTDELVELTEAEAAA